MTTQTARYEKGLSPHAEGTFRGANYSSGQATTATSAEVVYLHTKQLPKRSKGLAALDKLIAGIESSPEGKQEIADARKWTGMALYGSTTSLAAIRLQKGLSQKEVARICGMDQPHISRYEQGKCAPSITTSAKMAKALGISLDEFALAFENGIPSHE